MKRLAVLVFLFLVPFNEMAKADVPVAGFSDFSYVVPDSGNSAFMQGGIDFYYTKRIDDHTTFLAEIVIEAAGSEVVVDPERIWIQYWLSNWFKMKAGRTHTALGYWNDNFHHGSWLQLPVHRPQVYHFEDDGGMLPVHSIGFEFRGEGGVGPGNLGYVANYGNGRGIFADPPQMSDDANDSKAYNLLLYYELPDLGNLRVGATYYADNLPGNSDASLGTVYSNANEVITGAHLVWKPGDFQFISELIQIAHDYSGSETDTTITSSYALVGYKIEQWTPYLMVESITADNKQDAYTYIGPGGADSGTGFDSSMDYSGTAIGVRYDITPLSAIKVEGQSHTHGSTSSSATVINWSYLW